MPTQREKETLINIVRGIVLAQGNFFIKELLRRYHIKLGVTKTDFETSLLKAIENGELERHHVDGWLDEVEGWGDQHVYVYKVPSTLLQEPLWPETNKLQEKVKRVGLGHLWEARTSLQFPRTRKLTGISFDADSLRLTWHQGLSSWVPDEEKDYQKEIEGDLYEFRAHRQRADRSVMRFELRLSAKVAAVFLQEEWNKELHQSALQEVEETVSKIFNFGLLVPYNVSLAIKNLDQAALETDTPLPHVRPHSTRLSGAGVYVEFASTASKFGYQDFEPLRLVRRALKPDKFKGARGVFLFRRTGPKGSTRDLRIQLYGPQRRVRLWAQMSASEVWEILGTLKKYG